ncbi:MAG: hypothetical protein AAB225_27645 [Acidobacteriota bacterium]
MSLEEQQRSGFRYEYTTYQGEYSRKTLNRDRYESVVETPAYGVTVFKIH